MVLPGTTDRTALGWLPYPIIVFRTVGAQRTKPDPLPSPQQFTKVQGAVPSPSRGLQSQEKAIAGEMALFRSGGNLSLCDSEIFLVPPKITGKTDFAILRRILGLWQ